MTEDEQPSTHLSVVPEGAGKLAVGAERYQLRDLKQVAWFCGELAKSSMFTKTNAQGNAVPMNGAELFAVAVEGGEYGLSPLQALRNIYMLEDRLGRRTTIPRADLIAARIQADPRTEVWDVFDETRGVVTIKAKRSGRAMVSVSLRFEDLKPGTLDKWTKGGNDHQEMLYNRTVRKIARRFFRDMVLGLGVSLDDEGDRIDAAKTIDVGRVEEHIGVVDQTAPHGYCEQYVGPDTQRCGGVLELQTNTRTGGAFLRCPRCNATAPPPQAVRDAIRGVPPALTIAASQAEEVMPSGHERSSSAVGERDLPADVTPPPSDDDAPSVQYDAEPDGGASETETPSLPETEAALPEGVASTPTDAPEAVAELAMIQWRARARSAINKYVGEHSTPAKGKAQVVEALQSQGWDLVKPLAAFLRDASDEAIATLIGAFKIDVAS